MGRKGRLSLLLRGCFGAAVFALLFLVFHPGEILSALAQARPLYLLAGFALCCAGLVVRAWRGMLILNHMGIRMRFWRLLEVYIKSYWFSVFLPGSMGGDLYKIYGVSKASEKKLRPAVSIFAERVTGLLALLVVATVALALFHNLLPLPAWSMVLMLTGVGLATVALLMGVLCFDFCWKLAVKLMPFLQRLLSEERVRVIGSVCAEMRGKRILFAEALGLGLLIQVVVLAAYYVLALAITNDIPGIYFFTLYPLIEVASLAPITINGIGIKEGLLVFSLQYAEVDPAFAMGLGILFRALAILLALIGGILLMIRGPVK